MTPNWPWTPQHQITLYFYNNSPRVSNFTLFGSMTSHFGVTGHFETHRITSKWPWTLLGQRYTTYVLLVFPSPNFLSVLLYEHDYGGFHDIALYNSPKVDTRSSKKWKTTKWPQTELGSQKYSAGIKDLPRGLKFWSILLYDHLFSRYKVFRKSEMHWITPNWTWYLTGKSTLYTLNTSIWGPNLVRFALRLAIFAIQYVQGRQNWKCTEWPHTELEHLTVKVTLYTLNT